MRSLKRIASSFVVLENDNVDTDQIIPARYLTATTREGMGAGLFADWRYDESGEPNPEFLLNRPEAVGAEVLVAGRNFGCGSSREHAAWALLENGFRVVVSTAIADIFRANALKNGLLPVVVPVDAHERLLEIGEGSIAADVEKQTLTLPDGSEVAFSIDPFAKYCLVNGVDELGFLLQHADSIAEYEARVAATSSDGSAASAAESA
ncbi:MAG: 3-isopropylmalate dehydratase small subunit [Planctomycetota bacterium]|jgi:3-isopropylmalate/(R)-2-methylmalate dehydratase small subunit